MRRGSHLLSSAALRRWRAVHTWCSLICTLFLLVLCLTGLPLVFRDEIEDMLGSPASAQVPDGTPLVPLDELLRSAWARYPGDATNFISLPDDDAGMAVIGLIDHQGGYHWLKFDRHTGVLLDDQRQQGKQRVTILDAILAIHSSLVVGLPGTLLLGLMGLLLLASLVSGAVLYGPFTPRSDPGTLRLQARARLRWLDLHNVIGIVILAWFGVVGITGAINALEKPLFALWQSTDVTRLLAQREAPSSANVVPVELAVHTALLHHPGQTATSILFPSEVRHHPHHYLVWLHGDTSLTRELLTPVLIDVGTGAVSGSADLPWYLKTLEVSRPLHFGDYGGLPLKLLWLLFDLAAIVVLGSGVYLWFSSRRARGDRLDGKVRL